MWEISSTFRCLGETSVINSIPLYSKYIQHQGVYKYMQQEDTKTSVDYNFFSKHLTFYTTKLVVKLSENKWFRISSNIQVPERLVVINKLRTESKACWVNGQTPFDFKALCICDPNAPWTNKDKEFMLIGHIQCDKSLSLILLFAYETQLCSSPRGCWKTSILVAAC